MAKVTRGGLSGGSRGLDAATARAAMVGTEEDGAESAGRARGGTGAKTLPGGTRSTEGWPVDPRPREVGRATLKALAIATVIGTVHTTECGAQGSSEGPVGLAPGSRWDPIEVLGQPSRWRGIAGLGFGRQGGDAGISVGAGISAAIFRDFFPQHYAALALGVETYLGQRGDRLDTGVRLLLQSQALFFHGGIDRRFDTRGVHALLGTTFPIRRGGWPLPGALVRVDWLPGRDHAVAIGAAIPIGQPLAGRTRPRDIGALLPVAPIRQRFDAVPAVAAGALAEVAESSRWLLALHDFFWLAEPRSLSRARAVAEERKALAAFHSRLTARDGSLEPPGPYHREIERYHTALERAFGLAVGADEATAAHAGRAHAARARRIALEEIVLPYNAAVGQYKTPDTVVGLIARARARFDGWVRTEAGDADSAVAPVSAVAAAWFADFEALRAEVDRLTADTRMHWFPLGLALRPEEHRSQEQIDGIVAQALGRAFDRGNALHYIDAPQFQLELLRTIHETETYHILWIHDYAGRNPAGEIDGTAFRQTTEGYLRALIESVRAYDRTGHLPAYFLLLDLHNYELRDSRIWLDLLERPLDHRMRLPPANASMARVVEALQDSLMAAVAGSRRLQAEANALGRQWITSRVRVHVNITNPSDVSFRAPRILRPLGADNLMRDHRKIVIRDVTEARPTAGEVILTGAGVGDHYTSPTWDDRALLIQGPAALEALERARATLERHGFVGDRLPAPLRPLAPDPEAGAHVAAHQAAGADAHVLQVHNRTGFGPKEATFIQTLLYDLAPQGSIVFVPNGLWTSHYWMAQLVNAAARGVHVYLVAPAGTNAPAASFPQMSRMQELLTRLVLTRELFGGMIEAAGGDLRIGMFARETPFDDRPALLAEIERRYLANPFLWEIFPFTPEVRQTLLEFQARPVPQSAEPLPEPQPRPPQLHQKVQLIASLDVLRALAQDDSVAGLLNDLLANPVALRPDPPGAAPLIEREDVERSLRLPRRFEELEAKGRFSEPVLYFLSGSMNLNVRSMALDGEATAVVAGPWALLSYLDFAFIAGGVEWIADLDELDGLLPPYGGLRRLIGRWLHYVL